MATPSLAYATALGMGSVPGRYAATKDEQPKGKPVPLPPDDGMGQGGSAPLPKR